MAGLILVLQVKLNSNVSLFHVKGKKYSINALGNKPKIMLHTIIQVKKSHLDGNVDVILTLKPLLHSSNNRSTSKMKKIYIGLIACAAKSTQTDYPSITPI